eukprot:COSAG01_NODE_13288_length_1606_cov_7.297943_1_plen_245_part_00
MDDATEQRVENAEGMVYVGELNGQKPQGRGTLTYGDGTVYAGSWWAGKRHGQGRCDWPGGASWYEGEWYRGKRHGRGKSVTGGAGGEEAESYEGQWQEGRRHGRGNSSGAAGSYDGGWLAGQRDGFGVLTQRDGAKYEGEWVEGRMEGKGRCTWADGKVYEGDWKAGQPHGIGRLIYADGETMVQGEWAGGFQHGRCAVQVIGGSGGVAQRYEAVYEQGELQPGGEEEVKWRDRENARFSLLFA